VTLMNMSTYTERPILGLLFLVIFGLVIVCTSQHFKYKKFCRLALRSHFARGRELKEAKEVIRKLEAQRQEYLQRHLSILPYHNPNVTVVYKVVDAKDPPDEGPTVLDRILADDT
jgi:uncharacterized membrane protein